MSCKWVGKGKGTCKHSRAEGVSRLEVDLNMNANIAGFRSVFGILPLPPPPLSALLTFQNVVYTHYVLCVVSKFKGESLEEEVWEIM